MSSLGRVIQLTRPAFGEEEMDAVREVLESGWVGLGPRTMAFERAFAAHVGARFCVGTNSATAALHLSLLLLDLSPQDEVIVPAITFVATAHAVRHAGGRVVLADVEPGTLTLDPADVARKVTRHTRALIAVHYGGHPCAMDALGDIAASRGFSIVEDAAHAAGATYRGRRIGEISPLTCFSFQATKNMTTGEGGAVTTERSDYAERLARLRCSGIDSDTWQRVRGGRHQWSYDVAELGFKYHMHDLAAAIGLVQLARLDGRNELRRRKAAIYDDAFASLPWLETPVVHPWVVTAAHNYVVHLDRRDDLHAWLGAEGIASSVHYEPLHHHSAYRDLEAHVPAAEAEWTRILLLPLYPELSEVDQARVIDSVCSFGAAQRRTGTG